MKALRAGDANQKDSFLGLGTLLMKRLLIRHARPRSKPIVKTDLEDGPQRARPRWRTVERNRGFVKQAGCNRPK